MKPHKQLQPTIFAIFGGSGDLTWRKLVPSLIIILNLKQSKFLKNIVMAKHSLFLFFCILVGSFSINAREIHVSVKGSDVNDGTASKPYKTISRAAQVVMPGDVITVHEGVYREQITPTRGGNSDKARIIYQAAKGEKVEIKGSENIHTAIPQYLSADCLENEKLFIQLRVNKHFDNKIKIELINNSRIIKSFSEPYARPAEMIVLTMDKKEILYKIAKKDKIIKLQVV